ncbi:chromatin remodelling complex Rsc7/Swp82 subunit-domain-containing protein [Chlamydoabsidia padenii]|nr:chromatin remodelling complex Rsc7/Swp82 subunit-domain-containing protein [Chlamydoabsidia padenii]
MVEGAANNTNNTTHLGKRKGKQSKTKGQGTTASPDDTSFLDDESDLSFDEDLDLSDTETTTTGSNKKRGPAKTEQPPQQQAQQVPEEESDTDEAGEKKVDKDGHLLEGREYKVLTFELPQRGRTLFMFSKDPAALLNFRDSFVFIKKNPKLVKVYVTDEEKSYLVETNKLRATFRTRDVSVVSARSVYKVFGHRVVKKGRRGKDDYYYTGEYDENEPVPDSDDEAQALQRLENDKLAAAAAAAAKVPPTLINTNMLQSTPTQSDIVTLKPTLEPLNAYNWLHHAAVSVRDFSAQLHSYRQNNTTFYDIHTNAYQIPHSKQATTITSKLPPPSV